MLNFDDDFVNHHSMGHDMMHHHLHHTMPTAEDSMREAQQNYLRNELMYGTSGLSRNSLFAMFSSWFGKDK